MSRSALVAFAFALVTVVAASPSAAAIEIFMFVDGIAGVSPDDETHQDWILLNSMVLPVQSDQPPTLGGVGPILGDMVITKEADASSVALMMAALNMDVIPKVKIDVRIGGMILGPNPNDFVFTGEWTAELAEFLDLGPAPADPTLESYSLNFSKMQYDYWAKRPDGTNDGKYNLQWNDVGLPPITSTEGTPEPFKLFNEVFVPEPASALLYASACLLVSVRRHPRMTSAVRAPQQAV